MTKSMSLDYRGAHISTNKQSLRYLDADIVTKREFKNFRITRYTFKLSEGSSLDLSIDREGDGVDGMKRQVMDELTDLFKSILDKVHKEGAKDTDHVHIYLSTGGQDFRFVYNKNIREGATLQQMRNTEEDVMEKILLGFSDIIQSGDDVTLDDNTKIEVYTYSIPSGGGGKFRVKTGKRKKVLSNLMSVISTANVKDESNLCFPQALYLCSLALDSKGKEYKRIIRDIAKAKTKGYNPPASLLNNAREILLEVILTGCADLSYKQQVPLTSVKYFAEYFNASIHVYSFSTAGSKGEFIHHAKIPESDKHFFVLFDSENAHYDPIVDVTKFLRTVHNNGYRDFCSKCYASVDTRYHTTCESFDPSAPEEVESSRTIKRYKPDVGEENKATEFIQKPKKKADFEGRIVFFDFETQVVGFHRDTGEEEEVVPYTSSSAPSFEKRVLHPDYDYRQVVVYGAWKDNEDNHGDFHSIDEFMEMLDEAQFKNCTLVAHNGSGYDFQLMLEYYYSQDVLRLGGDKPIVMKGSRIVFAEITNGIRLIDSYSFISQPLSALPKMFDLPEGLSKGYYPYVFDQKKYNNYRGEWPGVQWYEPNLKKPKAREALIKWHEERVASGDIFDLKEQRAAYCKDDVEIGLKALLKFCEIMVNLETPDGQSIGAHPLHYMTAASMAFKGVFLNYFMKPNQIAVVKPPTKENFSWKSIAWFEHLRNTQGVNITHALNGGEKRIYCPSVGKELKVDGYCHATRKAFEFHGCEYIFPPFLHIFDF